MYDFMSLFAEYGNMFLILKQESSAYPCSVQTKRRTNKWRSTSE